MFRVKYKLFKKYIKIKHFFSKLTCEKIIFYLQIIAWLFLLLLVLITLKNMFYNKIENALSLMAAIGILISALLASYSMLLNISKNIELKNIEHSNKVRNIFFQLCLIKMRLITLIQYKERSEITYLDIDSIFGITEDIANSLQNLNTQDMVTTIHNNVLSDIHFVYLEFLTATSLVKAARNNLIHPNTNNSKLFPNPLLKFDMRLEIAVERLTSALTYLKNGYEKDFPEQGGLEDCAEHTTPEKV